MKPVCAIPVAPAVEAGSAGACEGFTAVLSHQRKLIDVRSLHHGVHQPGLPGDSQSHRPLHRLLPFSKLFFSKLFDSGTALRVARSLPIGRPLRIRRGLGYAAWARIVGIGLDLRRVDALWAIAGRIARRLPGPWRRLQRLRWLAWIGHGATPLCDAA
jgi:hypothetical protein